MPESLSNIETNVPCGALNQKYLNVIEIMITHRTQKYF